MSYQRGLFRAALLAWLWCVAATSLQAQESDTSAPDRRIFWRAQLSGGKYMVLLEDITSISTHTYLVDSAFEVTELTIITTGKGLARFYYVSTDPKETKLGGAIETVAQKAGVSGIMNDTASTIQRQIETASGLQSPQSMLDGMVVKNYPTTTHANTVEYRLKSKQQVEDIFKHIEEAWRLNLNKTYKEK